MLSPPASIATAHNKLIGLFISARLITQSRLTPGRLWTPTFANAAVLMIYIAHLSYCCHTEDMHLALLSRWQAYQGIITLFCHKLSTCTRATHHLTATTLR